MRYCLVTTATRSRLVPPSDTTVNYPYELEQVLDSVQRLDKQRRTEWLIDLGAAMTISARAGYPAAGHADSVPHLIAFNELQHQLFGYLRHMRAHDDWTLESFLQGLCQEAKTTGVECDFGWALKSSVERLSHANE